MTQIKAHTNTSSGCNAFDFRHQKTTVNHKSINTKYAAFLLDTIQPRQISIKIYFLVVISTLYLLLSEV